MEDISELYSENKVKEAEDATFSNRIAGEFKVDSITMELAVKNAISKIDSMRLLSTTEITDEPQLLRITDGEFYRETMSLGDISMIQGAAKSRKSTLTELIARYLLTGALMGGNNISTDLSGVKILYIDTEQSEKHTNRQFKRITYGMDPDEVAERIFYIPTVDLSNNERKAMLRVGIEKFRPNLVMIDGIVDLCANFLDNEESQELVMLLKRWSKQFKCHILTVLHTNPDPRNAGTKARGHLGTILVQKCQTVINVRKVDDENGSRYSVVSAEAMRDLEFKPFNIGRDEHGNPMIISDAPKPNEDDCYNKFVALMDMDGNRANKTNCKNFIMSAYGISDKTARNKFKQFCMDGLLVEENGMYRVLREIDNEPDMPF